MWLAPTLGSSMKLRARLGPTAARRADRRKPPAKAELLAYLRESFDYGDKVLATITEKTALDRVYGRYAGPNSKLGMASVALWHISDHYGQIVEYLRMNRIVPAMTQKYGLAVR